MSNAVFLRVLAGILGGFALGCMFVFLRLRSGLTRDEWRYFKAFHQSLLDGTYDYYEDDDEDERSEDDED